MMKINYPAYLLTVTACCCLCGCFNLPTASSQITGSYISPNKYRTYNCDDLTLEASSMARRENMLVIAQEQRLKSSQVPGFLAGIWSGRRHWGSRTGECQGWERSAGDHDGQEKVWYSQRFSETCRAATFCRNTGFANGMNIQGQKITDLNLKCAVAHVMGKSGFLKFQDTFIRSQNLPYALFGNDWLFSLFSCHPCSRPGWISYSGWGDDL